MHKPNLKSGLYSGVSYLSGASMAAAFMTGLPQTACAQDSLRDALSQDEIVVTATRRGDATNLLKTPVAVSAFNAEAVEAFAPRDLQDIAVMTPGLSPGNAAGFRSANFAMRGVAETSIIVYKENPVGVIIDDFVVVDAQTQDLELFDIEQIEVLRGPQGTLFGKNTTAGAVTVRTKRPRLDEADLEAQASYGSFGTAEAKVALNLPIAADTFGIRAAGMYRTSDGYYRNGYRFGPIPGFINASIAGLSGTGPGERIGGDDVFSGRLKALWEPTEAVSVMATYEIIRDRGDSVPIVNDTPAESSYAFPNFGFPGRDADQDPLDQAGINNRDDNLLNMSDGHRIDVDGFYLNADADIGNNWQIHSVTGYRKSQSRLPSDYVANNGPEFTNPLTNQTTQFSLFDATRDDDREVFQQELRLTGTVGRIDLVGGVFYQETDVDFCVAQTVGFLDIFGAVGALGPDPAPFGFFNANPLILCNAQESEAVAGFVDGTWDITDRLHLSGGFRYTREEKAWTGRPRIPIISLDGNPTPAELGTPLAAADFTRFPTLVVTDSEEWSEPTWRINLGYDASDDIFVYANYARGFRSGGYNDQTGTVLNPLPAAAIRPVNPEFVDSYEAGLKASFADGRATLTATGFLADYTDAQRTFNASFEGGQETLFFNAADLSAKGLELEGTFAPKDNLVVRWMYAFTDADYDRFEADTDFDGDVDVDLSGRPVTRVPKTQYGLDATYTFPLGDWGDVKLNGRVTHEDESVSTYSDVGAEFDTFLDGRTLVDADIRLTAKDDKYYVRLIGKNLTDERYRTGSLSVATLWVMSNYGEPRYFGVEVGTKFGFGDW
ncbi:MAG: TonB-dependent receptor [Hyphomonadaceae bacterium]|nr:TonB-dependent receptor [Hyphomonadaceae bacterium]MBC6412401.1 TonB-dependent receptor [Hyphomonadaceae bacterium]